MIEEISRYLVRFLITIILARLLLPSDYGIIGLIAVFIGISQVFINSGFGAALIQKKDRNEIDFSTVFYFNLLSSVFFWVILLLLRGWFARYFNQPILYEITPILGLNIVFDALAIVHRTKLTIDINFKVQAKATLISTIVAGLIGIGLAYVGYGVWALVVQMLLRTILNTVFLFLYNRWLPSLVFSYNSFKELFSYGSKLMLSGLLNILYLNIYTLIIGKFFSASQLGFYTRAKNFKDLPSTNFTNIVNKVSFPAFCKIQDDDERMIKTFRKFLNMSVFVITPIMLWMMVFAKPIIILSIKEKWEPSVILLQILCLAGIMYPIHALNLTILQVKGRSDLFLRLEIIKKILTTIIIVATFSISVKVMVIGSVISSAIGLLVNTYYTKKILNYGLLQQINDFKPVIVLSIFTMLLMFVATYFINSYLIKLIVGSFVGLFTYISVAKFRKYEAYKDVLEIIKGLK